MAFGSLPIFDDSLPQVHSRELVMLFIIIKKRIFFLALLAAAGAIESGGASVREHSPAWLQSKRARDLLSWAEAIAVGDLVELLAPFSGIAIKHCRAAVHM